MSIKTKITISPERKRILVVDDQARDTRLMKLCLERNINYEVREENDSQAAISSAEEFQPDLILLDLMMPGMDGQELAACFEANPKLTAVPIVFLTAAISKEEVDAVGGKIGRFPFLAKPFVLSEMSACLKRHLGV